jgi:DNA repair protein RadD
MIPRPYQDRLVSRVVSALETYGNTLAIAPTGAGKTIMMSMVAGRYESKKILVLQHRDELVSQNLSKFQKVNPNVPVSLYTADVKSWRGKAVFGMVQTLSRPVNLLTVPKLDLLIVDEAHHVAASSYLNIIAEARQKNPDLRIAGFTATPSRGDRRGLRSVFSNCADQITLKELIDRGFLVQPRAFVVDVNGVREGLSKVRKLASDFDMDEVEKVMNKKIVNDEVIKQWKEKAPDRKTIVFASTIAHASDVLDAFRSAGIPSEMITGKSSGFERAVAIRRLKSGETRVIVNVAVLTEGFDEPSVSCVVLLRPCSFKSTMIQMIGRGLRTVDPDQYPGLIKRDCIILDFGTSIITHGNIEADSSLGSDKEKREESASDAPYKVCPDLDQKESEYIRPDANGNFGCGAQVPTAVKACPLCGFLFEKQGEEPEKVEEVILTEVDLLNASPFRWVDLFGSGKVMMASGFEAWAGVMSSDEENWFAVGKQKSSKTVRNILIGDRLQAFAAADDFLRESETGDSANKSKRWLRDPATDRQKELLRQVGYSIDSLDFSFTKYSAAAHLNFQWNKRMIESALFARRQAV